MKNKPANCLESLLANTTSPQVRAALLRTSAYLEGTRAQFYDRLQQAQKLNVEGVGVLAGPVKRAKVGKTK